MTLFLNIQNYFFIPSKTKGVKFFPMLRKSEATLILLEKTLVCRLNLVNCEFLRFLMLSGRIIEIILSLMMLMSIRIYPNSTYVIVYIESV